MSPVSTMTQHIERHVPDRGAVDTGEQRLVEMAARGSEVAFREIYERHLDAVSRTVARVLGPGADLDDAIQEVFVTVHRSLTGFRGDCRLSTWLYRVAFRVAISHLRSRPRPLPLEDWRVLRTDCRLLGRLEARERVRALHAALEKVAPEAKEAFLLFEVEGLKLREIAELSGEPINTVTARIRRTREHLRDVLTAMEPEAQDG